MKKYLALVLAVVLAFSCFAVIPSAESSDNLKFRSDGKFKIIVFADTQDTDNPNQTMIKFINYALDTEKPDLVVFTGDNVVVDSQSRFLVGATKLIQPLIQRDIPYAYTFGNHDAERVAKPYMHSVYKSLGRCLTYNADDSIFGYGNCNIPIYSSNGSEIAFNLWMIDSNMYPASGSGYDYVHTDQINWFKNTDAALEASVGHKVNSLVFQHIVVPEVYNCLTTSTLGTKKYNGKRYKLSLNSSAHGTLGEFPCPPDTNNGEFAALKDRGDVIGIVTGHDHKNSFIGTYQGIDFIQFPGMTFHSYGDDNVRGYGVIELDEKNTATYSSHTVRYKDVNLNAYEYTPSEPEISMNLGDRTGGNQEYYRYNSGTFISEVKCAQDSSSSDAKSSLTSAGFTVIDYDLNKGARGNYIYMGYKTTSNPAEAIKDLCFYSEQSDFGFNKFTMNINGQECEYVCDNNTDLNKGSGGDYIYACYTKDSLAGAPITSISFDTTTDGSGKVCGKPLTPNVPADLNNGTSTHENAVYCFTNTNAEVITSQVNAIKSKYSQLSGYLDKDGFSEASKNAFANKMNIADAFIKEIDASRVTTKSNIELTSLRTDMMDSCAMLMTGISDGTYLYGIASPTEPDAILDSFNDYVTVNVQPTGRYLGTGSKVTLNYDGRSKELTTVTFGDVNGDGWYDGQDATVVSCIKNGLLSESAVGGAAYIAADCNHDGVIDELDVDILNNAGILLANIDQSKSGNELLATSSDYIEYISLIVQCPIIDEPEIDPEFSINPIQRVIAFIKDVLYIIYNWLLSLIK